MDWRSPGISSKELKLESDLIGWVRGTSRGQRGLLSRLGPTLARE